MNSHSLNDYLDTTTSLSKYEVRLNANVQNGTFPATFQNNTVYQTYIPN